MKVKEAAERLEVSAATIYTLTSTGKLRCARVGMGRGVIRISEEQIAEYLKSVETGPEVPRKPEPREVGSGPSKLKKLTLNGDR